MPDLWCNCTQAYEPLLWADSQTTSSFLRFCLGLAAFRLLIRWLIPWRYLQNVLLLLLRRVFTGLRPTPPTLGPPASSLTTLTLTGSATARILTSQSCRRRSRLSRTTTLLWQTRRDYSWPLRVQKLWLLISQHLEWPGSPGKPFPSSSSSALRPSSTWIWRGVEAVSRRQTLASSCRTWVSMRE